jgi:hypothetical protein
MSYTSEKDKKRQDESFVQIQQIASKYVKENIDFNTVLGDLIYIYQCGRNDALEAFLDIIGKKDCNVDE